MGFRNKTKCNIKHFATMLISASVLFCFTSNKCESNIPIALTKLPKKETEVSKNNTPPKPETIEKADWKPNYHISLQTGNLKQPYAITKFNETYHLFYGTEKNFDNKQKNVWGHFTSKNLLDWKQTKNAIEPTTIYDNDNVYGGSAIVADDLLYILYTGEFSNGDSENQIVNQTQNLAMSKDGWNFGKSANNPIIPEAPNYSYLEFSSSIFKNPYVWKLEDRYYALVGSQYLKGKDGAVLLFKSKDLRNWVCINVTALGQNGEMGHTWEQPALLHIENQDVLVFTAKGIKPHEKMFLNKSNAGAFLGHLNYDSGKFAQKSAFMLFDYGFDFQAPHFMKLEDGRHILIASLGMDDTEQYEKENGWSGILTIPRELKIVNNKIITLPAKEIQSIRGNQITLTNQTITEEKEFNNIKGESFEINTTIDMTDSNLFTLKLRVSQTQETIIQYNKETKTLKLDRNNSGIKPDGKRLEGQREATLPLVDNKLKLNVFVDKSSIEIFANDGVIVMSSRIYPDKNAIGIKFSSEGEAKIEKLDFYKLKTIKIE